MRMMSDNYRDSIRIFKARLEKTPETDTSEREFLEVCIKSLERLMPRGKDDRPESMCSPSGWCTHS